METWILIMTLCAYAGGGWGGEICHSQHVEFNSKQSCEAGLVDVKKEYRRGLRNAMCVQK
jgi:hypothetical protein